eukprot:1186769-Prorocentrum_minimum.AAC.2
MEFQRRAPPFRSESGPIGQGERAYTRDTDQSGERRGHIPAVRTNRTRREGIYPRCGPIGRGERAYTRGADQSGDEGRGHIPAVRTNRTRGEGIYARCGPIR